MTWGNISTERPHAHAHAHTDHWAFKAEALLVIFLWELCYSSCISVRAILPSCFHAQAPEALGGASLSGGEFTFSFSWGDFVPHLATVS